MADDGLPGRSTLWDSSNHEASQGRWEELRARVGAGALTDYRGDVAIRFARTLDRQRRFEEGHTALHLLEQNEGIQPPGGRIRDLLERRTRLNRGGRASGDAPLFEQALRLVSKDSWRVKHEPGRRSRLRTLGPVGPEQDELPRSRESSRSQ